MKVVSFRITGTSPMLMNNPLSMISSANRGLGAKKIPSPEEEAAPKVYRLPSGVLFAPAVWFKLAMANASKGRRIGKMGAAGLIASGVFCIGRECALSHPETHEPITEYAIDIQRCVIGKAGVFRARPRIDAWETTVSFEFDEDRLGAPSVLQSAMEIAGPYGGVGDYRPSSPSGKGGDYGRFKAVMLEE